MIKGFLALRRSAEQIISFVEMTMLSNKNLPCFKNRNGEVILEELRRRFKLEMTT